MPFKFLLIIGQILLLTLVLYLKSDYLYYETLGKQTSYEEMSTTELKSADATLVGVSVCFIIFMAFEFFMQILGVSLMFNETNMLQIFLHILGCTFTTWFILDKWSYTSMWPIWVCFGLFPFLLETSTIVSSAIFSANINKNKAANFRQ